MNLQSLGNPSLRAIPHSYICKFLTKSTPQESKGTNVGDQPLMWQATHKKKVPNSTNPKQVAKLEKE
jgi:hypothetical protein